MCSAHAVACAKGVEASHSRLPPFCRPFAQPKVKAEIARKLGGAALPLGDGAEPLLTGLGLRCFQIKGHAGIPFVSTMSGPAESLGEIGKDILDVFDSDREPHVARRNAGCDLRLRLELRMRRRGGMDREAVRVADVCQMQE